MAKKRQPTTAAAKDDEPLTPVSKNDQPPPSKKPDQPPPSKKPAEEKVEEKDDEDSTSEEASSSEGEEDESSSEEEVDEEEQQPSSLPTSKTPQTEKSGSKKQPETEKSVSKKQPETEKSGSKKQPETEKSGSKKQPASKTTQTEKSGSKKDEDDEDEEETDTDSESDNEPPSKLKSINSKSISKPEPNSSATPARSGTKRPAEDDTKQSKKKKTTATAADGKKEKEEDNKKPGEEKKLFQRVFNDDDELAILKGLVDFIAIPGNDPFKYPTAFYDFVRKSISFPVTLEQLKDKVRRLKGKFETKMKSCKRGKTPTFSKPNEEVMFEYGKKIWGGNNVAEENGKPVEKPAKKGAAVKKPDLPLVASKETRKESPCSGLIDQFAGVFGVSADFVKSGVEMMEESEKMELKTRWKELQIAELKLVAMRAALAEEQARLILNVLGSSSSSH